MEEESSKARETSKSDSYKRVENSLSFNPVLHNAARKLLQIIQDKDHNIEEKDQNLQQDEEEMDNLRKNIIHLQTEYELLDHKYRAELSYREEIEKRNDTTRDLIDTVQNYAEILASSIKMLDDDKFKIMDFYNEIHRRQEATEAKRKKLELTVKELDEFNKNEVAQINRDKDQLLGQIQQLTAKKTDMKEKLKNEIYQKNELERKIEELKEKISEIVEEVNTSKINESKLRNKLVIQKVKDGKIRKMEEKQYQKKIKLLHSRNKSLTEKLSASQETILFLKENLEVKYLEMQRELQKTSNDNSNEVKNLEEKLNLSLSENDILKYECKKFEMDLEKIHIGINKLNKEELETTHLKLQEQENELKKKVEECLIMKEEIEKLNTESQEKMQMISYFQVKSQNSEELNRKINDLEDKVRKYSNLEAELQNKIALQNEKLRSQRSDYEMLISEQKSQINILEEDMARVKLENKNSKYQLDESIKKYNDLKNEFQKRSAEVEKLIASHLLQHVSKEPIVLIFKLKSKITEISSEKVIVETSKTNESTTEITTNNITSTVPNSSRKLLSTPVRLLQSPGLSPTLKPRTPIMKKRDPYNFDSDSSAECLESDKTSKNIKTGQRKGNSSCKRSK